VLSVFAFGILVVLLGKTNPIGNCCLSLFVSEGIPLPICFAQSIHSLIFKSGPRVSAGRKVLIFKDLLLQSIPFMALISAMEEEDEQVLGVVPLVLFYLGCQGLGVFAAGLREMVVLRTIPTLATIKPSRRWGTRFCGGS